MTSHRIDKASLIGVLSFISASVLIYLACCHGVTPRIGRCLRMLNTLHRTFIVSRIRVHAWLYNYYAGAKW